jgi:polysaccharide export outer membrane protein
MSSRSFQRALALALLAVLIITGQAPAQNGKKGRGRNDPPREENQEIAGPSGVKAPGDEAQRARRESPSEAEAAVVPYINNYFETFRLGPEDVITVDIFGQERYSRSNITIPPDGRINYPLAGQIKVVGLTTAEVERDLTEKLREYIIEPKVTVQLVQSHSQKFFVVGDVGAPGIYEMTRRMTVTEALARAGYITRYGSKTGVRVLRLQPSGQMMPLPINMKDVESGKSRDIFLAPGDTVVVPGSRFKKIEQVMGLVTLAAWARTIAR